MYDFYKKVQRQAQTEIPFSEQLTDNILNYLGLEWKRNMRIDCRELESRPEKEY